MWDSCLANSILLCAYGKDYWDWCPAELTAYNLPLVCVDHCRMLLAGSYLPLVCMNLLHAISGKQELSPKIRKLQASCADENSCQVTIAKEELKQRLTPLEYHVTQERGTEKPFSGKFVSMKDEGVYNCVVCGNQIFSSDTKYNSHSGWPSFYDVLDKDHVVLKDDTTQGAKRMEVRCADCQSHLGHVFDDGPKPTGIRYCVNSASLDFRKHTTV